MKSLRIILTFSGLLLPALAVEVRPVSCRFLSFGASDSPASLLAVSDKGAKLPCPLNTDSLSEPVVCFASDNKISFLSSADQKPAAMAIIPATAKSAVLVFVMDTSSAAPSWRVFAIDDSARNFPDGGAYIANFYNQDIRFIIGEHKGMLHSAGHHGYALPAGRDKFNMAPVVFEFLQEEDLWRTASESSLRFVTGMRYLIFAYTDPASGRPRIKTFQDLAPPALAVQ